MRRRIYPNLLGDVSQLEERQARLERILQAIGFTPEYPFTLTVNDGTRNRVLIGKIGDDYGIQIIDNDGNEIVFANGVISAGGVSGTLKSTVNVGTIISSAGVKLDGPNRRVLIHDGTNNRILIGYQSGGF